MATQTKTRYYVHGDRVEDEPDSYYCAACDVFFPEAHFAKCHCKDHYARYERSLKGFKQLIKNGSKFTRPTHPFNLFA